MTPKFLFCTEIICKMEITPAFKSSSIDWGIPNADIKMQAYARAQLTSCLTF